jgi:hypothetical protein
MRMIISVLLVVLFHTTAAFAGSFNDNSDGTVTDLMTKLMWQQCSAGLSGTNCATGAAGLYTWANAITYCEGLPLGGFTDWRLPNFRELQSVTDMTMYNPAINTTYFPATQSSTYWSSTTYADATTDAWVVNFINGMTYGSTVNGTIKTNTKYIRCVRGRSLGNFARLMRSGSPVNTYSTLQNAYTAAAEGDMIQAQAVDCAEILMLSRNVSVVLKGGYNSGFASNPGFTTVGSLSVSSGTVMIDNIIIM